MKMNRPAFLLMALFAASVAMGANPLTSFRVDIQTPQAEFQIRSASGSTPTFQAVLMDGGSNWTGAATVTNGALYYYATNWPATNWVAIPFASASSTGVIFQATQAKTATSGVFVAQVVVLAGDKVYRWGRGTLTLDYVPPLLFGATTLDLALGGIESDPVAGPGVLAVSGRVDSIYANIDDLTNRVHIIESAGLIGTNAAAALTASIMATGLTDRANSAAWISTADGKMKFGGIDAANLYIVKTTNTPFVIVTATNGAGYNGPSVGTTWINPVYGADWQWDTAPYGGGNVQLNLANGMPDNVFAVGIPTVYVNDVGRNGVWTGVSFTDTLIPSPLTDAIGTLQIEWVQGVTTQAIPLSSMTGEHLLAVDSMGYTDVGPWVNGAATNGNAAMSTLGFYGGYPWQAVYSQYTNGQQGRVAMASIAAPSFVDAKLNALRFFHRAYNAADSVEVMVYAAGSESAFMTNTLTFTNSETVHLTDVSGLNVLSPPGMTIKATVKVTAATTAGTWTALPRVEAIWSK